MSPKPAPQDRSVEPAPYHRCELMCPPTWTGHWRDWHRGHNCHLDPERAEALVDHLLGDVDRTPCPAQEWQRDGRGLWAMRACRYYKGHKNGRHDFGAWRYYADPHEMLYGDTAKVEGNDPVEPPKEPR